jgi:small-conductance mechanosensitive channel
MTSFIAFCWLFLFEIVFSAASAQGMPPLTQTEKVPAEPSEIQSVIDTLENPEARERLIGELKVLLTAQQKMAPSPETPTLGSTTVDLMKSTSKGLAKSVETTVTAATMFHRLPLVWSWLETQISNLDRLNLWLGIIKDIAGIIGSAYLVFFIARWFLKHASKISSYPAATGLAMRLVYLVLSLLLDLLPVMAFAIAAYLMLGLIDPSANVRLAAIAWINAAVMVHVVTAFLRFFFAPHYPQLRLLPIDNREALHAVRWGTGMGVVGIYGYFALQAALMLDLPLPYYETLLRFLGLLVAVMLIILILQKRQAVARYIRGKAANEKRKLHPRYLLGRLASAWHVVAVIYVLMLYGIWALALTNGFIFILKGTVLTAFILFVGNALVWLIDQSLLRGLHIADASHKRFPNLEYRLKRYLPILQTGLKGLVYLLMLLAVFEAWGISAFDWITTGLGKTFSTEVGKIVGIVVATLLVWEVLTVLLENYLSTSTNEKTSHRQPSARIRTLLSVAHNALLIILVVTSTLIVISDLGINIAPLLAGVGVAGLAFGFGAQKLVQDINTGLFILFEDLIAVGDVVSVGDKSGLVEAITIRTLRLRDLAGNVRTIPFSSIGAITNMTREFSYYVFDVGVSYGENVDIVMDELAAIGKEMTEDPTYAPLILEPLEILGLDSFASSAVMIKARIKTLPIKQWQVGREFNRRMKIRFDQRSIEIPFTCLTVYMKGNEMAQTRGSQEYSASGS